MGKRFSVFVCGYVNLNKLWLTKDLVLLTRVSHSIWEICFAHTPSAKRRVKTGVIWFSMFHVALLSHEKAVSRNHAAWMTNEKWYWCNFLGFVFHDWIFVWPAWLLKQRGFGSLWYNLDYFISVSLVWEQMWMWRGAGGSGGLRTSDSWVIATGA